MVYNSLLRSSLLSLVDLWFSIFSKLAFPTTDVIFGGMICFLSSLVTISSVQFSRSVVSNSLQSHELQHARPPCPSPTPRVHSNIHRVCDAIQPSHPLSFPSPPAPNPSQHQGLFQSVNSSHEVAKYWSFSFSISPSDEYSGFDFI